MLKRFLWPAAKAEGITLGGWHDFRHSRSTMMERDGVGPKVRAAILGHSVEQTLKYGEVDATDFEQPLVNVTNTLLRDVTKTAVAA